MPYNNTAIPPPEEVTGQSSLPMTRIKKIIRLDEDIVQCSNNAAFVISVATEMFIQYLAEQGHKVARSEKKPRKNIQYRDLATAVSRVDNLEFLSDVIPKTTTYKQFKEKKAKESKSNRGAVQKGQKTLNAKKQSEPRTSKGIEHMLNANGDDDPPPSRPKSGGQTLLTTMMVDRTVESPSGREKAGSEDDDDMKE